MGELLKIAAETADERPTIPVKELEERARAQAGGAERRARANRTLRALDVTPDDLRGQLAQTPLAGLALLARDEHDLRTLAHTIDLNDLAVADLVLKISDPFELAFAIATVTQKALHTFVDPRTGARVKNLSGAKRAGTFFTPPSIACEMADLALTDREAVEVSLEPASGTAMLTSALLIEAARRGIRVAEVVAWELSPYLARLSERVLLAVVERLELSPTIRVSTGDAIALFNAQAAQPDVLVMNPPYGRVKYLKSEATNAETRASDIDIAQAAGRDWVAATQQRYVAAAERLGLQNRGLDHQRVFMAAGLRSLADGGRMVCIAPSSWTSGPQSRDIRELLLRDRHVEQLILYREDAKLFPTVNQPTAVVVADASGGHRSAGVTLRGPGNERGTRYEVNYDEILGARDNQLRIPMVRPEARGAFQRAMSLPRLGDLEIKNARGELDLTNDAWMLTTAQTETRVVRGDHLERYELLAAESSSKPGMISASGNAALSSRTKWADSRVPRVVGRQVAYIGKRRRLTFAEVPPGAIVANSCNYLLTADPLLRRALLGYLNSSPAEWFFRLHSANNHVSNGEIAGLPWPLQDHTLLKAVAASTTVRTVAAREGSPSLERRVDDIIDALVCVGMELTPKAAKPMLEEVLEQHRVESVISLLEWIRRFGVPPHLLDPEKWMQHELNTLSALDYEMIRHVPIGGNWQQIPESVPSERLRQIREMSKSRGIVRTTYYGRLRPEQPAYTIATYYNRPGNGTNIHPHEDRTLSHREAARLQSFPDDYAFIGGDGAVRKQIGNAVPPLLGQAVAQQLISSGLRGGAVVDLFAGAGGLSLGFELAGLPVAVAAENDKAALRTYAFNRPTESIADPGSDRTLLIDADLSRADVREDAYAAIRQKLNGAAPGVLVGGPPCQGFSYAGFRNPEDPRSDLAVAFLDFVEALRPEAVVLENVEGLLTARGGKLAKELLGTLAELGYPVALPWVLAAEQFGVPQMRRRVFLVALRGQSVTAPQGLFDRCLGRRENRELDRRKSYPVTVSEALGDLPALTGQQPGLETHRRTAFADWVRGRFDSHEFLRTHADDLGAQ